MHIPSKDVSPLFRYLNIDEFDAFNRFFKLKRDQMIVQMGDHMYRDWAHVIVDLLILWDFITSNLGNKSLSVPDFFEFRDHMHPSLCDLYLPVSNSGTHHGGSLHSGGSKRFKSQSSWYVSHSQNSTGKLNPIPYTAVSNNVSTMFKETSTGSRRPL